MTPDQRAALEILLDAKNVLDTDTQLMPLIRFVLFGTTGTVGPEPDDAYKTAVEEFNAGLEAIRNLSYTT